MYQILPDTPMGAATCIKRIADNAFIPFDPANTDYQEYLKWLDAGNTPLLAEGNEPLPSDSAADSVATEPTVPETNKTLES